MDISSCVSTKNNTPAATAQIIAQINAHNTTAPSWLYISYTCTHDADLIASALRERYPGTPIHGSSSHAGVMTQQGHAAVDGYAVAAFALWDEAGSYGAGVCEYADDHTNGCDIESAVNTAIRSAMIQAGREGEAPVAVWLHTAPGQEEDILAAITRVIGQNVPVLGGSSADNNFTGNWSQIVNGEVSENAISLSVLYPSSAISYQFHSGYKPAEHSGIATRCDGHILYEIDHKPAAEVYNQWTNAMLEPYLGQDCEVLSLTTLHPIGRIASYINSIPQYKLSHPGSIRQDGGIGLFTQVQEGEQLCLMSGTIDSLVTRAGRVVNSAIEHSQVDKSQVKGALLIYCAGCLQMVADQIDTVSQGVNEALNNQPFVGAYTLGEQGCFQEGVNLHGNLMISALVFL